MGVIVGLLTDEIILQAPTREKPYTIRDGRGLFVLVHPNGSRYFQMRATVAGRRKLMQLGVYPQISITEARALSADRLQEELDEAESGVPTGAQDESGSLFMEDVPEVAELPPSHAPALEERIEMVLDEEIDPFEDRPRVPTPKVNLAYDQLVYIPSTLPKTFTQKFAARFHPSVLVGQLVDSLAQLMGHCKKWWLALIVRGQCQCQKLRLLFAEKLKMAAHYPLIKIDFLRNGIKIQLQKLKRVAKDFKFKKVSTVSVGGVEQPEVVVEFEAEAHPVRAKVSAVSHQALMVVAAPKKIAGAVLVRYQKLGTHLQSGVVRWAETLRSNIERERSADRRDVISAYGLFAEAKGNYLIYTIKALIASVLIKKG